MDAVLTLSLLHLLEDREAAIAKIFNMLKPGGVFVSSTVCLGDRMGYFRYLEPIGRALGVTPYVAVFSQADLVGSLARAGFEIKREWRPEKSVAVFIVARKPAAAEAV